jgi:hypothetical protein
MTKHEGVIKAANVLLVIQDFDILSAFVIRISSLATFMAY